MGDLFVWVFKSLAGLHSEHEIRTLLEITADRTGWSGGGAVIMLVFVLMAALIAVLTKKMKFYASVLFASACGYILTASVVFPLADACTLMPVFPFVMIIWIMGLGFIISNIAERFLKDQRFKKMIYTGVLFVWTVSCICLLITEEEAGVYDERLASLNAVVVIAGEDVDKDAVILSIGNMYGYSSLTFLMEDGVFGDRVCLLSK